MGFSSLLSRCTTVAIDERNRFNVWISGPSCHRSRREIRRGVAVSAYFAKLRNFSAAHSRSVSSINGRAAFVVDDPVEDGHLR